MFDHIGNKIKNLATVICWLGIAASVIAAIAAWSTTGFLRGLIALVAGCLGSWIGSFFMYGFGELVENSTIIREKLTSSAKPQAAPVIVETKTVEQKGTGAVKTTTTVKSTEDLSKEQKILADGGWKCTRCGKANYKYMTRCDCGTSKMEALGIVHHQE